MNLAELLAGGQLAVLAKVARELEPGDLLLHAGTHGLVTLLEVERVDHFATVDSMVLVDVGQPTGLIVEGDRVVFCPVVLDRLEVTSDDVAEADPAEAAYPQNRQCTCGHRRREHFADGVFGCSIRGCSCVGFDASPWPGR